MIVAEPSVAFSFCPWRAALSCPCACEETARFVPSGWRCPAIAHGACIVKELSLQLCGRGIPLHDQRGSEAAQHMLFLFSQNVSTESVTPG